MCRVKVYTVTTARALIMTLAQLLLLTLLALTHTSSWAIATLNKVTITPNSIESNGEQRPVAVLKLKFDQPPSNPTLFSIHSPERLIIDIPNSQLGDNLLSTLPTQLPSPLEKVDVATNQRESRLIILSRAPLFHQLRLAGSSVELALFNQADQNETIPTIKDSSTDIDSPLPLIEKQTVQVIPLNYSTAADMRESLINEKEIVGVDARTNSLIIEGSSQRREELRALITSLDTPSQQVLIESRIVIASTNFSHELGARLGLTHLDAVQNRWGFSLSGNSEAANNALSGTTPGVSGSGNRLAVNLPVSSPSGQIGLTLAKLATGSLIDLELSAAQVEGKTEIIANPRIITSNGYEAAIQQGVQIPYRSDTLSGGTDISFKDAVMELKVTPQITPEQEIILTIQVKKDAVGAILCTGCEPSVDTREIRTRVMVESGETLVVGGIYEERKSKSDNRVPLLSDIPIIGQLFQSNGKSEDKGELLVFITPSIIEN